MHKMETKTVFYVLKYKGEFFDYKITRDGQVYSEYNKINRVKCNGYYCINITKNGKTYKPHLHRILAETFIDNPHNYNYVYFIDGNKENLSLKNLKWSSKQKIAKNHNKKIYHEKKVLQIEIKTGKIVREYSSSVEAGNILGCDPSGIRKVCNGIGKTAKGYGWEFKLEKTSESEINKGIFYGEKISVDLSDAKLVQDTYYAFKNGEIYNSKTQKYVKPVKKVSGYCYFTASGKNKKNIDIHRAIVSAFSDENISDYYIDHINKIKHDNRLKNLQIVSASENTLRINMSLEEVKERSKTYKIV